jgi:itaconate CoA-transferase
MTEGSGPLAGVRVIGLEHSVAGPLCTRILGDMGADVVKVERRGGDFSRHWDHNAGGESAQFWWLNRGKRSIELDLKDPSNRRVFDALLAGADVFVHNLSPAAALRLGLDDDAFQTAFPQLVCCQISGYGSSGAFRDRKAYDMLLQAESGVMSVTGRPEEPTRVGVSLCDIGTGIYAAALVLGALIEQRATGAGRRLDVSMMDTAVEFVAPMLMSYANAGVVYERIPQRHHAIAPYGVFSCADGGALLIAVEQDDEWRLVCDQLLGDPLLADDPRFTTNSARVKHRGAVDRLMSEALAQLNLAESVELCERLRLAYGVLNEMPAVRDHPVVRERGALRSELAPRGESIETVVGIAERAFRTQRPRATPPRLDEHRGEILSELQAPRVGGTGG